MIPRAAIERFEDVYVHWDYSDAPGRHARSALPAPPCSSISSATPEGPRHVSSTRYCTYIVTARGRGLNSLGAGPGLAAGMGAAALANAARVALLAVPVPARGVLQRRARRACPLRTSPRCR
jgi:hypothetical protein